MRKVRVRLIVDDRDPHGAEPKGLGLDLGLVGLGVAHRDAHGAEPEEAELERLDVLEAGGGAQPDVLERARLG